VHADQVFRKPHKSRHHVDDKQRRRIARSMLSGKTTL
jgi:hypothetical protein